MGYRAEPAEFTAGDQPLAMLRQCVFRFKPWLPGCPWLWSGAAYDTVPYRINRRY